MVIRVFLRPLLLTNVSSLLSRVTSRIIALKQAGQVHIQISEIILTGSLRLHEEINAQKFNIFLLLC